MDETQNRDVTIELSQVDVTIEVFKIFRSMNEHNWGSEKFWQLVAQHLPDVPGKMLTEAILTYCYRGMGRSSNE